MKPGLYIIRIAHCTRCDGAGSVRHPLWDDFYRETAAIPDADAVAWFQARGYGRNRMPAEEEPCPSCRAHGYTTEHVLLADALRELGTPMYAGGGE